MLGQYQFSDVITGLTQIPLISIKWLQQTNMELKKVKLDHVSQKNNTVVIQEESAPVTQNRCLSNPSYSYYNNSCSRPKNNC